MIIPGFNRKSQSRGAAVLAYYKWPKNIIPYDISSISSKMIILPSMDWLIELLTYFNDQMQPIVKRLQMQ